MNQPPDPRRSWDDMNLAAVLLQCVQCKGWFYMTHVPKDGVCIACR